jgi:hypothetical protein
MKENSTSKKEVIAGAKMNLESLYYTALFSVGSLVSAFLLYRGITRPNKALMIYSIVLLPLLFIATLISLRFACVSKNTIYKKNDKLVVKTFFITRRHRISEITRLTAAQNGANGTTAVNITNCKKTVNYTFKKLTNEEIARLRRAASAK